VLSIDDDANEAAYGQDTTPRMIFEDRAAPPSPAIAGFRDRLVQASASARAARQDDAPPATTATPPTDPAAPQPQTVPQPEPFQPVDNAPVDNPARVEALPATP